MHVTSERFGSIPCRWIVVFLGGLAVSGPAVVLAQDGPGQPPPLLPRHAHFVLHPGESSVSLSLFTGGTTSKLAGTIKLFLGDPDVVVIALVGMVGLSVDGAELIALDFEPNLPGIPEPMRMIQDPRVKSIGAWNYLTGVIDFELHLIAPGGNLPVPQPVRLSGRLANSGLEVSGDNGNVPDGTISLKIKAFESTLPPPPADIWFSTEVGFGAATITPPRDAIVPVSDGDLLSRRGFIVRTNRELTRRLGIMPVVPDLGLDAVMPGPWGEIWFSFEEQNPQIWSETLGVWLKHGDLLSDAGRVVRTNEQLLRRFVRMPPVMDAGLDAVARGPDGSILFSTETSFLSEALGRNVGHGDLLSDRGRVVRTNRQLLERFRIIDMTMGPLPPDYGLDAIILRPNKEIWFSTEIGFLTGDVNDSSRRRQISDGDLLSSFGYVVASNLDLVSAFGPIEDVDNFGLDATTVVMRCRIGDLNFDGLVDQLDLDAFHSALSGPSVACGDLEFADFDGDGDSDQTDFGILQRSLGSGFDPADADPSGLE